jgi:hypothetical protein
MVAPAGIEPALLELWVLRFTIKLKGQWILCYIATTYWGLLSPFILAARSPTWENYYIKTYLGNVDVASFVLAPYGTLQLSLYICKYALI